ncbi:tetratricopeptide repeat protein [Yoonia maricola]|uniref:Tetratricopeptide repeat protein n=1 Tax=Yoonia maricola TaxID=420999 RepID=A0A2M8W5U3_9RHOB|nr:tetratricopeptide repeat protein [Yoonia maricola]PJI86294.1 tetratricopeptide repeat protein [Yoonia maricola]
MTVLKRSFAGAIAALMIAGAQPVTADPDAGAYLAARQAGLANDFGQAARFFTESLIADPTNAYLLENAMTSYIAQGDIAQAIPVAQTIVGQGNDSQIAYLTLMIADAKSGNWAAMLDGLEAGRNVGPLVDSLAVGWAYLGQGDIGQAIASFDKVIATEGMMVYGLTHKAYALASAGDFEGAEAIFSGDVPGGMRYSRQSAIAHAQILSQLGRNTDALGIVDAVFGEQSDPSIAQLRAQLRADEAVAYSAVRTPEQGLADLFHVIAGMVQDDAPEQFTLMYTRAATYLWPENTPLVLMNAGLLEELEQYDLANAAYATVARDDPSFHVAELGRAEVLRSAGRNGAAIEVLEALTRSHPDLPEVYATKGDTLRQAERYKDAITAYSRALTLYDDGNSARWFVHFTRGIAHHKVDDWPGAEADFRAALALRPDHPQVLNYLGYSLVERGEKLDEALGMIETAAAERPDNGAIVDSLGWVYFQFGRYEEAVEHLERAASLEPVDPVINDHLGDALWAVGREIEARFQWERALSFDPVEEEALRIRDKLQRGLDLVLVDEGRAPIRIASGDD